MEIESIKHKGLKAFAETGKGSIIEPKRIARMLSFIDAAGSFSELVVPPNYGFHALKGNRNGEYAMTVTKNFRMTFTKVDETTIANLDLEDYH